MDVYSTDRCQTERFVSCSLQGTPEKMMNMTQIYSQLLGELRVFFAAVSLILAFIQIFAGYRILRGWISAGGFLIGMVAGAAIVSALAPDAAIWVRVLVGLVLGSVLGWIAWKIYLAAVFVYCGLVAASAVLSLPFPETGTWSVLMVVIAAAVFIAAGMLSVHFSRPVVIIMSSVGGASSAVNAMTLLQAPIAAGEGSRVFCFVVLVTTGLVVQFLTTRQWKSVRRRHIR